MRSSCIPAACTVRLCCFETRVLVLGSAKGGGKSFLTGSLWRERALGNGEPEARGDHRLDHGVEWEMVADNRGEGWHTRARDADAHLCETSA